MISMLTTIIQDFELQARLAVATGDDKRADWLFRVADSAFALLMALCEVRA